jgi:hypothetical protein
VWGQRDPDFEASIRGRRYEPDGRPRGSESVLNFDPVFSRFTPVVGLDPAGGMVVVWEEYNIPSSRDLRLARTFFIHGQRFGGLSPAALEVDTAGNGVLEPGETVDLRPAWRNLNGAPCTSARASRTCRGPIPSTRFVETLLHQRVTGGCAPGLYCPASATTRQEMAAFVLAAREGGGYAPAACVGAPFADVPASSAFCPWVAELARRGVVAGCGGGNCCPADAVTRQEMGVFISGTFGLGLYGP